MSTMQKKKQLKYNIKERLNALPIYDRLKLRLNIINELGCSEGNYTLLLNISADSTSDIKGRQLQIFAKHLGCSIEDLFNDIVC